MMSFAQFGLDSYWMAAVGMAGAAAAVVIGVAYFRLRARHRQVLRAIDCMYQGFVMYDANKRLVLRNRRYMEIYGLSADVVKPGVRLIEVLRHRIEKYSLDDNAESYRGRLLSKISAGKSTRAVGDTGTGRMIAVNNVPTGDGGWVGTHEDVTEQLKVEKQRDSMAQHEERRARIETAITSFRSRIESLLKIFGDSAGAMKSTVTILFGSSNRTTERADRAVQESNSSSENVKTAANAAEELSASISEISRQLERTTHEVPDAAVVSQSTNIEITNLSHAAQKIGDVVELIRDVAAQTNLLALNATIEAARAGSAGRGFAVVAAEVKSLAVQTGRATEEIAGQIQAVQTSARDAVEAIGLITARMDEINGSTSAVAASVEQPRSVAGARESRTAATPRRSIT